MYIDAGRFKIFKTYVVRPEDAFVRIPGYEPLSGKVVCIVGVGSLGSRLAIGLTASGVRRFCLIDHDVYEPANAVRHECGIRFFGIPKVNAVGARILELNPECARDLIMITGRVGCVDPAIDAEIINQMARADLIINATGSAQVSHWIDEMAYDLNKTRIHVSVTSGAWAGEVIRIEPGKTPCWRCHQEASDIPPHEPNGHDAPFAPGCAMPTFTGSLPEVSVVADLAAWMAIETLLARPTHNFAGSYLRWAGRQSDTGQVQPSVTLSSPPPRPCCPLCFPK